MASSNPLVTMYAGNRRVLRYTVVDEAGAALDLTGYTVKWAMSRYTGPLGVHREYDETPVLQRTSATGGHMNITPESGIVEVILAQALTAGFEGVFHSQLEIFDASSNSCVVAVGDIEIKRNVVNT